MAVLGDTDTRRCALADLLPGHCSGPLHSHHVYPVNLGGDPDGYRVDLCARHHPMLEALARRELRRPPRCRHIHPTREGREACERRLAKLALVS